MITTTTLLILLKMDLILSKSLDPDEVICVVSTGSALFANVV